MCEGKKNLVKSFSNNLHLCLRYLFIFSKCLGHNSILLVINLYLNKNYSTQNQNVLKIYLYEIRFLLY